MNDDAMDLRGLEELLSQVEEASSVGFESSAPADATNGGPADATNDGREQRDVLEFSLGPHRFAVEAACVREILGEVAITPLPGAPGYLLGIIVARRQVVGILDLERFFRRDDEAAVEPPGPAAASVAPRRPRIVIVETPLYTVGLAVEQVEGLASWPEAARTFIHSVEPGVRKYSRGVHMHMDSIVVLLDIETLLDDAAVR